MCYKNMLATTVGLPTQSIEQRTSILYFTNLSGKICRRNFLVGIIHDYYREAG